MQEIKHIKTHTFQGSLRTRLLSTLILISIVPSVIIGFIAFYISSKVVYDMASESSVELVDRVGGELENLFFEAYKLCAIISDNLKIQTVLRKEFESNSEQYAMDLEASTELYFIKDYKTEIFGLYVIGENGGRYRSNFYTFKEDDFQNKYWYQEIIQSASPVWSGPRDGSRVVVTTGNKIFELGIPVIDKATGNKMGIILIEIAESKISSIINAQLGKTGFIVVLNKENEIIAGIENKESLDELDFNMLPEINADTYEELDIVIRGLGAYSNESSVDVLNELPLVVTKSFFINGWKVVGFIPRAELTKNSKRIGLIVGAMILFLSVLSVLISLYFSGQIVKPIRQLIGLMGKVEDGDLNVNMELTRYDEIGLLSNSFNMMISRIKGLMSQVYEDQKKLEKAKFKTLQAQINPHFLYNTLDSVIWLARAKSYAEIVKLTTALTKYFRIGLSRGEDLISIQEELKHVENYLIIQSIRYKDKFNYVIDVEDDIKTLKIIKIVLQPLAENAIYHGIKMKRSQGLISITGRRKGEDVLISVKDTGAGMSAEHLNALNNTLHKTAGIKLDSYGVINVEERIRIFFGPGYGISYNSEEGIGTEVVIRMPAIKNEA
jgi:two-component system sensor histidine kinase YesM